MRQHSNSSFHNHTTTKKAQAQMISIALYSAIIVIGISIMVVVSIPVIENMRDAEAVDAAMDMLTGLEGEIRQVADADEGSMTQIGLQFARGTFIFDADEDSIIYELETDSALISPHTTREIGNLRLSSATDVSVTHDSVDNTPCWRMENDHISVCIRDLPQNETEQIEEDTVGYWRFNENRGSTTQDISSHRNHGDIVGAQWTDGVAGSALAFDGTSDYVDTDATASGLGIDGGSPKTASAWVYTEAFNDGGVFEMGDTADGEQFSLRTTSSPDEWKAQFWGADCCDFEFEYPSQDRWTHLALVYNGTHGIAYADGEKQGYNAFDADTGDSTAFRIGRWGVDHFDGTIDEVRVWDRALDENEIEWIYKQRGHLDFIDTHDLILEYYNKDADEYLDADFGITLRTDQPVAFTHNGTGYVEPVHTGGNLGRGEITAEVQSFFGVDYDVIFKLLSGSDFLQVDVEN